ncbi:hypothetical protein [Thiomonas sp. X19]|uniref:hypothetical protein n=1 Tax=Thiomonas sp. X19 TaxID=1050370 RepID=UPI001314AB1C|nr:hypothetical protein [Thiomonas sp. X19]
MLVQLPGVSAGMPVRWDVLRVVVTGLRRTLQPLGDLETEPLQDHVVGLAQGSPERPDPAASPAASPAAEILLAQVAEAASAPTVVAAAESMTSGSDQAATSVGFSIAAQPATAIDQDPPVKRPDIEPPAIKAADLDPPEPGPPLAEVVAPSPASATMAPEAAQASRDGAHPSGPVADLQPPPPTEGKQDISGGSAFATEPFLQLLAEIPGLLREQIKSWRELREAWEPWQVKVVAASPVIAEPELSSVPIAPMKVADMNPDVKAADSSSQMEKGAPQVRRHQPWDAGIEVRLARIGAWSLALPATCVLGVVPMDNRSLSLPRGEALLFTDVGAVPVLSLESAWGALPAETSRMLLLQYREQFFALRVDTCAPVQTLHFWSIPPQIGAPYGIEAAAVMPQAASSMAFLLSLRFLSRLQGQVRGKRR